MYQIFPLLVIYLLGFSIYASPFQSKSDSLSENDPLKIAGKLLTSDIDSSIVILNEILDTYRSERDVFSEAEALKILSQALYFKGLYNEALVVNQRLYAIYDSVGFDDKKGFPLNSLGLVLAAQKDHTLAIDYYLRSLEVNEKNQDSTLIGKNYMNLSISFMEMDQADSAITLLRKSMSYVAGKQNSALESNILNLTGQVFIDLAEYDSSLLYFQKALEVAGPGNFREIGYAKAGLANVYFRIKQYSQAMQSAQEGLNAAMKISAYWEILRIYELLSKIAEARGDFKLSLDYHKNFKAFSDSIYTQERSRDFYRMSLYQKQTENERLNIDTLLQNQQIRSKNLTIKIGVGLLLAIIILISILLWAYNQKTSFNLQLLSKSKLITQKNKELEKLNATKDKMFSIISHDLSGPLATLQTLMTMVGEKSISKADFTMLVEKLGQNVKNITFTLANLLHWARLEMIGQTTGFLTFNIKTVVQQAVDLLQATADQYEVKIFNAIDKDMTIFGDANGIGLVFRNLISNALKFTPAGGEIRLSFGQPERNMVHFKISDTGVGIPPERLGQIFQYGDRKVQSGLHGEKGTGLGLILCYETIQKHGGKISVSSEIGQGSTFTIYLPLSVAN